MQTKYLIREILGNIGFRLSQIDNNSFYLIGGDKDKKPIQIRVSNHCISPGMLLDIASGKDSKIRLAEPSSSINISIVFINKGIESSSCKDAVEYIYYSDMINRKYLKSIINAIRKASIGGRYIDPLRSLESKKAKTTI